MSEIKRQYPEYRMNDHDYNESVDDAILKISGLTKWNEYIEFNGECYGLPRALMGCHMENDCGGKVIISKQTHYQSNHRCIKCNHEYAVPVVHNYKVPYGFILP